MGQMRAKIGENAMGDINIKGFSGANNVKLDERFYSKPSILIAEPRVILNADVDLTGKLVARVGKKLVTTLSGAHSLWAGLSCRLCVAGGYLYRIIDDNATSICAVLGPKYPFSYTDAEDMV